MDYIPFLAPFTAIIGTFGAVFLGMQTGKTARSKDARDATTDREKNRLAREQLEEAAARILLQDVANDAANARQRLRETEEECHKRVAEAKADARRGWDLASHHFNVVMALMHLLNNIFLMVSLGEGVTEEAVLAKRVLEVVRNAQVRMKTQKIPRFLEEPLRDDGPQIITDGAKA